MRVFDKKGLRSAKGLLLPYTEFKLFSDLDKTEFNGEKAKKIVTSAEKLLERDIPLLPASLYREFATVGNRANFEGKFFLRRDMAVSFAVAEAYENKGRFTEKLMDVVWAIMEESTWLLPAHLYCSPHYSDATLGPVFGDNSLHGLALFAASTCGALATVYMLCKDKLDEIDPVIARKMEYSLKERGIKNFLQTEFWWGGGLGRKTNNWCPWILSNILLTTAVVEKDTYVRERVVSKAMNYLDNFLACYEPDGGCDEGPAYWGAAGASLFDCLELIEDMSGGQISIWDSQLVKNIGDYIYKVNISGNRYVNFADCAPQTSPNAGMLVRFGQKTNSSFLVSFGKKQAKYGDHFFSASHMYRSLKWLSTPYVKDENCPMPLYSVLPDLGVMTARECEESDKGMFLAAKAGTNGEMHNHNDCGNFMVYYNGNPVIIDTGVGTYTKQTFSPDRYKLWFMQSGYHNLPSFDGIDQREGGQYRATEKHFDESERSAVCELRDAYPKEAKIESYVRRTSLCSGVVTVSESIRLREAKEIDFHLMLASKPELTGEGKIALPEGRHLTYDTSLSVELEEFDPVGMNTVSAWGTDTLYRLHFRINTDKCDIKFIIA
ncbi:MAG: heparinase II/III family protein [Clostridia bacterium]|nr:heparinase II/III family protein [Clostridia bacterium]